jgi:hypothetical protein
LFGNACQCDGAQASILFPGQLVGVTAFPPTACHRTIAVAFEAGKSTAAGNLPSAALQLAALLQQPFASQAAAVAGTGSGATGGGAGGATPAAPRAAAAARPAGMPMGTPAAALAALLSTPGTALPGVTPAADRAAAAGLTAAGNSGLAGTPAAVTARRVAPAAAAAAVGGGSGAAGDAAAGGGQDQDTEGSSDSSEDGEGDIVSHRPYRNEQCTVKWFNGVW